MRLASRVKQWRKGSGGWGRWTTAGKNRAFLLQDLSHICLDFELLAPSKSHPSKCTVDAKVFIKLSSAHPIKSRSLWLQNAMYKVFAVPHAGAADIDEASRCAIDSNPFFWCAHSFNIESEKLIMSYHVMLYYLFVPDDNMCMKGSFAHLLQNRPGLPIYT